MALESNVDTQIRDTRKGRGKMQQIKVRMHWMNLCKGNTYLSSDMNRVAFMHTYTDHKELFTCYNNSGTLMIMISFFKNKQGRCGPALDW